MIYTSILKNVSNTKTCRDSYQKVCKQVRMILVLCNKININ